MNVSIYDPLLRPFGQLGIIALSSFEKSGKKLHKSILKLWSGEDKKYFEKCLIKTNNIRFANGEGKMVIEETVRNKDIYILADIGNYSCTYDMYGMKVPMGPDEHFQDIKRCVAAIGGRARRISVVMPLLYASRQDKRRGRESLDCALALQELERMGVKNIITFDAHETKVQNAIPLTGFENLYPTFDIIKTLLQSEKDLQIDKEHMMVIAPDTGAMDRGIYYGNLLSLDVGLFYKRRDFTRIVDGKNPIIQHEYLGSPVEGKDILIVDDMIASGQSVLDLVEELKKRNAKRIFIAASFAFFNKGLDEFNVHFEAGNFDRVFSTNLTYVSPELKKMPWYKEVQMEDFLARIITTINFGESLSGFFNDTPKIQKLLTSESVEKEAFI